MTRNHNTRKRFIDIAKSELESIAEADPTDYNVLDVEYTVGLDGDVREITLITATGGPHVTVELFNRAVEVAHGSSTVRRTENRHLDGDEVAAGFERLAGYYEEMWEASQ